MRRACIALALLAGMACDKSKPAGAGLGGPSASDPRAKHGAKTEAPPPTSILAPISSDVAQHVFASQDLPNDFEVKGTVIEGLRWADNNGENFIVFSVETIDGDDSDCEAIPCAPKTRLLRASHLLRAKSGATKVMRKMKAREADCEYELVSTIVEQSLAVTDLDSDGIGEASFAFRISCSSDMAPLVLKLLLFEDGDKYIIRGHTRYADQDLGDDKEIDQALREGDPRFLAHATQLWDRIVKLDPYQHD